MSGFVTHEGIDVAQSGEPTVQVTQLGVDVVNNPRGHGQVTSLGVDVVQNPRGKGWVTSLGIDLIVSVTSAIRPLRVESTSEIRPPWVERKQDPGQPEIDNRESNPYKPSYPQIAAPATYDATSVFDPAPAVANPATVAVPSTQDVPTPASDQILFHMMREQTEQLRQQHEKTQAGDTTMPWEFLTRLSTDRLFTLGSQGRFYHDSYGMIVARYVKFTKMIPATFLNSPVGRLATAESIDWIVTNDFSRSGSDLAAGILAAYELPAEGEFGWIITCGANHTNLKLRTNRIPVQNDDLVWVEQESLGLDGSGLVMGRIIGRRGLANLSPGMVFINLEGPSRKLIESWFGIRFTDLTNQILALADRVALLESADDLGGDIDTIFARLDATDLAIRQEAGTRQSRDAYILGLIADLNAVSQDDLDEAVAVMNQNLTILRTEIYEQLTIIVNRLDALQAQVSRIPNIEQRIIELQEQIGRLQSELSRKTTYIPLVTGEVPPVFVYLDDGSLVLVEVDYDGAP
jgi:uncharacterized protein YceH (UPF0502 family)